MQVYEIIFHASGQKQNTYLRLPWIPRKGDVIPEVVIDGIGIYDLHIRSVHYNYYTSLNHVENHITAVPKVYCIAIRVKDDKLQDPPE